MKYTRKEMDNFEKKLLSFAELDYDEYGQACVALCEFRDYAQYISEELEQLVEKEMINKLKYYEDNFELKKVKKEKIININTVILVEKENA